MLAAIHAVVHIVVLLGGLGFNGADDAGPSLLAVQSGIDDHRLALIQGADVQLGHSAFYPEFPGRKDGDEGFGLAGRIGGRGFVDLFHHAGHFAEHLGVFQRVLQLFNLLLLGLGVILLGFDLQLYRLDLHRILVLFLLTGLFFLLLQVLLLLFQGGDGVRDALQVQLGLIQAHLHFLGVIAEQGVPRGNFIALGDVHLRHGFGFVLLDAVGFLGFHHTGIAGGIPHVYPGDIGHRFHIDRGGVPSGKQPPQPEEPQAQGDDYHRCHTGQGDPKGFFQGFF